MESTSTSHLTDVKISPDVTREKIEGMLLYRNAALAIRGLKEFTRPAYNIISKSFVSADLLVDCTNRSFMVTGANSAIGQAVAVQIASKGGTVHMVCRSRSKGLDVVEYVKGQTGNERVHLHIVDLSKPTNVVSFTKQFLSLGYELHVLVNVAGCLTSERVQTVEGFDLHFATNTLGTYILTAELMSLLQFVEDPRVVMVSSGGMLISKLNINDLDFHKMDPYDGSLAYAQTKRQIVVMTEQLTRQYPGVYFASMHPGWVDTPGLKSCMPEFYKKLHKSLRTPEQGADTIVWLAVANSPKKHAGGQFFQDRLVVPKHLPMLYTRSNPQDEKTLMSTLLTYHHKYKLQEEQQNSNT